MKKCWSALECIVYMPFYSKGDFDGLAMSLACLIRESPRTFYMENYNWELEIKDGPSSDTKMLQKET